MGWVGLSLLAAISAPGQATAPTFTDAAALLDAVAKTYAMDADAFHFESVSERIENDELQRTWQKSLHTVIKAPGGRFFIEARTPLGNWLQESDGTTEWVYLREAKKYVKRPAGDKPFFPQRTGMDLMELKQTWDMRTFLDADAEHAKQAKLLPDETILVGEHSYPCYVVSATSEGHGWHAGLTFWIEKSTLLLRKTVRQEDTHMMVNPILQVPIHPEVTTLYPVAEMGTSSDRKLFTFTPPADAQEVTTLEPEMEHFAASGAAAGATSGAQLLGQLAPEITLTGVDGSAVKLSSFRGQPLLVDEWATWCAPCLAWMPALGRLEREVRNSGVRVISVDRDEVAEHATHYMAIHGFAWSNYHDEDGLLAKALGEKRIPLTFLIDAEGRIAYVGTDGDEAALRKAIVSLKPHIAASTQEQGR